MKVVGIGNAIVDVICKVNEEFLTQNGLTKSTMKLVDEAEFKKLLSNLTIEETVAGGSVANSIVGLSQLGNKVSFIGKVNDDELGNKFEFSHYAKLQQRKQKFQWILDMQYRYVNYEFLGLDFVSGVLKDVTQTVDFHFFNPKASVFYQLKSNHQFYASVGRSNREPVRRDFRESTPSSRPKSEALMDYEVGYTWQKRGLILKGTFYYMDFDNQLVLTGQINDVGGYTRTNVKDSYRRGIEIEAKYKRIKNLEINGRQRFN